MKTIAFTSAAANCLPKVRKLCASIKRLRAAPGWPYAFAGNRVCRHGVRIRP